MASSRKATLLPSHRRSFSGRLVQNWLAILDVPWCGPDDNLNMGTLFDAHLITVFVGQSVVNPEVSIAAVGLESNLCFFLLARSWKRDHFFDNSGHSDPRLFSNSRSF